jgi:hypothetical protein
MFFHQYFQIKLQFKRALFYQNQCLANEDESSQRVGVVRVCYFDSNTYPVHQGGPDYELLRVFAKVLHAMPLRNVAFYLVVVATTKNNGINHQHSSPWLNAAELIVLLSNTFLRSRTRIIRGKGNCQSRMIVMMKMIMMKMRMMTITCILFAQPRLLWTCVCVCVCESLPCFPSSWIYY